MTNHQKFRLCVAKAEMIVRFYRSQSQGTDPQAWYVSTTMITLALVSMAVGTYGAVASASAQKDAANFNAKVQANNAQAQGQQAQYEADRIRTRNRQMLGAARASLSKSGVSITDGSAQDVMLSSGIQGELDRSSAIYKGETGAGASMGQSRLYGMQGRNAETSGYISAGSSILSGVSSAVAYGNNPNFNY